MDSRSTAREARTQARRAARSRPVEVAARAGFVARGVIYLLVGAIALQIAVQGAGGDRDSGEQADRGGALGELASRPFGSVLLWSLGIALAGMALWRLSEAAFGSAGPDGTKKSKRALAAARSVFYAFVAYSVLSYAAGEKGSGSGSTDRQSDDVTAMALDLPAGQWIVGFAGLAVVGAGVFLAVRAALRKFRKHLKVGAMSRVERRITDLLGVTGGIARGVLFAAVGVFALFAAARHEPGEAKGMDDTLRSFAELPAGPWLLGATALGLAAFGAFSWCSARRRKI